MSGAMNDFLAQHKLEIMYCFLMMTFVIIWTRFPLFFPKFEIPIIQTLLPKLLDVYDSKSKRHTTNPFMII